MSTVNQHYTFNYSQPEEYHFSHDSVFLARRIFEETRSFDMNQFRALDICSGSGIVGLDFLFHREVEGLSAPKNFDFLELQPEYRTHFFENVQRLASTKTNAHFLQRNYEDLQDVEFANMYDLIVSNPPYFFKWQGKQSPSPFKNRCKFFIDSDLDNLIQGIAHALKPGGLCFMLLRDLPDHGWNVLEAVGKHCNEVFSLTVLGDVSGTRFVKFTKAGS
jgi:tRNA1(Val) A37 N6-methylase TrmN6